MASTTVAPTILRRRMTPWPERRVGYTDLWRSFPLHTLLQKTHSRTLYLVTGTRAATQPKRDYWQEPATHGWTVRNLHTDPWGATYSHDGKTVDVRLSSAWWGDEQDEQQCRNAHNRLDIELRVQFDRGAQIMGTPARTGMDLLHRSLPVGREQGGSISLPIEYDLAPADLRAMLHQEFGQGRNEFFSGPEVAPDGLYLLDGRWMYAACVRHLPIGPWEHDSKPEYAGIKRPGFYRVVFQVPDGWHHIGILPKPTGDEDGQRFAWPRQSGTRHCAWVTSDELGVALSYGWECAILERWLGWENGVGADPARLWRDRLARLRSEAEYHQDRHIVAAARELLIQTIGSWWRQDRPQLHILPPGSPIPEDATDVVFYPSMAKPQWVEVTTPGKLPRELLAYQHPEWAATVWGRARSKLVMAAMRLSVRDIVALRTDAILTTHNPGWLDDGKLGTFRLKREWSARDVPRDDVSYRAMLEEEAD